MNNQVTREEFEAVKRQAAGSSVLAAGALSLASAAVAHTNDISGVIRNLEISREIETTTFAYSLMSDDDLELHRKMYESLLSNLRQIERQ